jgi:hypothetical protein
MTTAFAIGALVGLSAFTGWLCRLSLRSITSAAAPPISSVLREHAPALLGLHGVRHVGLGESGGLPCIVVVTEALTEDEASCIPARLGCWRVRRRTMCDPRVSARRPIPSPAESARRLQR